MKQSIIKINETNYEIKYNYKALMELERNGIDVFRLERHRKFDEIVFMLRVGIEHEVKFDTDTMITLMDTILRNHNIGEVFDLITMALIYSLQSDKDIEALEAEVQEVETEKK
jgi:hypothetical protein